MKTKMISTEKLSASTLKVVDKMSEALNEKIFYTDYIKTEELKFKDAKQFLADKWPAFKKAEADGVNPYILIDHRTDNKIYAASKARANKALDVANFMQSALESSGITENNAKDIMVALDKSGLLDAINIVSSRLPASLNETLLTNTRTTNDGARTYK